MTSPTFLFHLILLCLVAVQAGAQDGPDAAFDELIEVSEVLLDVLATDRSGEAVTGSAAGCAEATAGARN